jgi:Ca-activated chloride channel family protein
VKAKKYKTLVITLALGLCQIASANSAENSVLKGNSLYYKGDFNEAVNEYDHALAEQPKAQVPKFNKANCYFQIDEPNKAIELYNQVAADSKDMQLVEKAAYNLGNCYFRQGAEQKDSDPQKALEEMKTSIVCWRRALEINPENQKAAKNIEVARLIIKDIIDQINKQQKQQQQQAEKQKQMQQQLKELAEQQKALAQKTEQTKNAADKGQISPQQAQDSYNRQAGGQSQLKSQTEQTLQQDPNNPLPQQAADELKQALDAQSDAEKQLKESDGGTAKQSEDKAAEHIENALKKLAGENQQNQKQQQEQKQQPQEPNQPEHQQQQSAAVPDTAAQEILDKEQQEKKQRQILQRAGYQKVEKDW